LLVALQIATLAMILTPLRQIGQFYASSVGKKIVVALTALVLLGFLPVHVIGNLLVLPGIGGPDAINGYAEFLHTFGHGAGVWAFRLVLLTAFVIHVVATIQLVRQNRAARAEPYAVKTPQRSTLSSRTMAVSGIIILCFVVYHILHFTVRSWHGMGEMKTTFEGREVHDVYRMVVTGFSPEFWWVNLFYFVGVTLLCTHLAHGVASVFQTLGLRTRKTADLILLLGRAYALFIWVGFLSVPAAVMLGIVKLPA
jgi:succinate dehydrogenase / fumarate reductase, cytochrome b subunit